MSNFNKKILVACEYTGAFTNELLNHGFDVVSCDLLDSEGSRSHIKGDVNKILYAEEWLAVFAFPPCDYLSKAGLHLCNIENHGVNAWERIKKRNEAVDFFLKFYFLDVPFIFIENPIGHISSTIIKPTQIINPFYFGDNYSKETCIWLKGFPMIKYAFSDDLFNQKTSYDLVKHLRRDGKRYKYWTDFKTKKQRSVMSTIMAKEIVKQLVPQLKSYGLA